MNQDGDFVDDLSNHEIHSQEVAMASPKSFNAEEDKQQMHSNNINFNLNVDELVSNLDVDVPLESIEHRGEEELKFQRDDSQDVPIRISSQVSRNFGNSEASNAMNLDK